MMALMLVTASADARLTPLRACSASVRTALWTSVRARSVCGLNSLLRSAAKSPPSATADSAETSRSFCCSAMALLALLLGDAGRFSRGGFRSRSQRLQQARILQDARDELLRAGLAIHVRHEIGKLLSGLEQLRERRDALGDGPGSEVLHLLEVQLDVHVPLAGELVLHLHGDAGLHGLQAMVEVVDRDLEEAPLGDGRQRLGGVAPQVRELPHHER